VLFRLRPRDTRLEPDLRRLCIHVRAAAELLAEMVSGDVATQAELARRAADLDAEAEDAAHAVLRELAAALVTPVDRVDVFRVVWALRTAVRACCDVVDEACLFRLTALPDSLVEQVQFVTVAAEVATQAVPRLGHTRALSEAWIELGRLRKQSAAQHRHSLAEMTAKVSGTADGLDATRFMRLLQVERDLQAVLRAFESVGDVMQQIVVKEG
jgi:uncharacterized protein Yka (UPF0111/DUF47 family)